MKIGAIRTLSVALIAVLIIFSLSGCAKKDSQIIFELYENGEYENSLSENNVYKFADVDKVKALVGDNELLLVLIGAPWCPYCANDIGLIDERFKTGELSKLLDYIYYIDVEDSYVSTETVLEFNRTYNATMRTYIPCLMFFKNQQLMAAIADEQFAQIEDRPVRIDTFFNHIESLIKQ